MCVSDCAFLLFQFNSRTDKQMGVIPKVVSWWQRNDDAEQREQELHDQEQRARKRKHDDDDVDDNNNDDENRHAAKRRCNNDTPTKTSWKIRDYWNWCVCMTDQQVCRDCCWGRRRRMYARKWGKYDNHVHMDSRGRSSKSRRHRDDDSPSPGDSDVRSRY